jgi:hypothetical protein
MDLKLPDLEEHPLKRYTSHTDYRAESGFAKKPIHRPNLCKSVYVHGGFPMEGTREVQAVPACARLLHVVNMNKPRMPYPKKMNLIKPKWMWPMMVHSSRDKEGDVNG